MIRFPRSWSAVYYCDGAPYPALISSPAEDPVAATKRGGRSSSRNASPKSKSKKPKANKGGVAKSSSPAAAKARSGRAKKAELKAVQQHKHKQQGDEEEEEEEDSTAATPTPSKEGPSTELLYYNIVTTERAPGKRKIKARDFVEDWEDSGSEGAGAPEEDGDFLPPPDGDGDEDDDLSAGDD